MPKLQKRNALSGVVHSRSEGITPISNEGDDRRLTFVIISDNNEGMRYDWFSGESYIERLDIKGANTERLNTFFKDHERNVDSAIGKIENIRTDGTQLKADVIFGSDADSILNKYREGILTDVSIGYAIEDYEVEEREGEADMVTVTKFSIKELSAVGIGFDQDAKHEREMGDISSKQLHEIGERLDRVASKLT